MRFGQWRREWHIIKHCRLKGMIRQLQSFNQQKPNAINSVSEKCSSKQLVKCTLDMRAKSLLAGNKIGQRVSSGKHMLRLWSHTKVYGIHIHAISAPSLTVSAWSCPISDLCAQLVAAQVKKSERREIEDELNRALEEKLIGPAQIQRILTVVIVSVTKMLLSALHRLLLVELCHCNDFVSSKRIERVYILL